MTARLISTAVMARRHEPADSLDYFPTPPWATRALLEHVIRSDAFAYSVALDPACGEGHMALALGDYFGHVEASDIFDYGFGDVFDFLHPDVEPQVDWIITNPPFNQALEFIAKAQRLARGGVAVLVRTSFLEGQGRFEKLFSVNPPSIVAQFAERAPMHRGRWVMNGSTATAYCWLVWAKGFEPQPFRWIPPCSGQLTRHDDWLRFMGSVEPPDNHRLWKLLKTEKPHPALKARPTLAAIRAANEVRAEAMGALL